jgi:hypothetical protein
MCRAMPGGAPDHSTGAAVYRAVSGPRQRAETRGKPRGASTRVAQRFRDRPQHRGHLALEIEDPLPMGEVDLDALRPGAHHRPLGRLAEHGEHMIEQLDELRRLCRTHAFRTGWKPAG